MACHGGNHRRAFAICICIAFRVGTRGRTPTPTEVPTEVPTSDPTEEPTLPEPTPYSTDVPTEEDQGIQLFSALVATPVPPDPDCSDGQCVFWVKASTDDAGPNATSGLNCAYRTTWNEIYMGQCTNGQSITSGFRFPNVNMPAGSIIQEAHIEFTVDGPYTDDLNVAFYGENSANALPFSNANRPTNRPLTTTSAAWHIESTDPWALGNIRNSPSLTAIVQEIVSRSDWSSGNAVAMILKNVGPTSGSKMHRRVIGYDRPPFSYGPANAARLVITLGYDCSGTILSPVAQAVLDVVGDQEYCKNLYDVDGLITLPPGQNAFEKFRILAETAIEPGPHEIDFVTMGWDLDKEPNNDSDSPGDIFLQGIKSLYDNVQLHPGNYSGGVRVRILLGLKYYFNSFYLDQRVLVMNDLNDLEIERNAPNWTVEVAAYRNADQSTFPAPGSDSSGTHSHVKMMIVDGKHVIVGGYNMNYIYLEENPYHDMGVQINGPIANRALKLFDGLWSEAYRCDQFFLIQCVSESRTESLIEGIPHNKALSILTPEGNDVVFSLFRDDTDKTADKAITAAIEAANSEVNILQARFTNSLFDPPQYARAVLDVLQKGDGQVDVNLLVSKGLTDLPSNAAGICELRLQLLKEDLLGTHNLNTNFSDNPLHTKALSIDGSFIIVGSQNFDSSAWGEDEEDDDLGQFDLAEYSLGVDSEDAAAAFNTKFNEEWQTSDGLICSGTFSGFLQNLINQSSAGSVIFIPAGIYTESVTINKPMVLIGAGGNQTIFKPEGNEPAFRVTSSDVTIMNMKITGGSGYGIELIDTSPSSLKNIKINRVVFENNLQGGVLVQGLIPGSPMNYAIENNTFIGGADGVSIKMIETQAKTSFIRNNIFFSQSAAPIRILLANDSRVEYSYDLFDDCGGGDCAKNWYLGNVSAASSAHDNLFHLDPLFSSPKNGAYQLSTGSPAIDAGDSSFLDDRYHDGDNDGTIQIDIGAFEYAPVTNVPPVVNAGDDQTVELGNPVTVNASYSDADNSENHSARIHWGDGSVQDVATNMTRPGAGEVTGQHTYTTPGIYTIEICVVDIHGGVGCDKISAAVLYHFTGFFPPVDNQPMLNVVKAGSAIPVKFSLGGYQGPNIFAAGYPASAMVTCGSSIEDAIEQTVTAGASSLSYDATTDQYTYVWKTDNSWANTCRTFVLKLNDGSYHRADFKFKK